MVQSVNQFAITPTDGDLDLPNFGSVITAQVSSSEPGALVAGQAVKLEDSASPLPSVLALTADTDQVYGLVVRNLKDANRVAGEALEIAQTNAVMWKTASGAIGRGAPVYANHTDNKVSATPNGGQPIGYAFDKAAANNDQIRVSLTVLPAIAQSGDELTINVTATLAEINAGKIAIPAIAGRQIVVTDFIERVTGAFTTNTSVNLQSDTTSVIVEATAVAGLTNGAVLIPGTANVTLGAGFGAALPVGEGVKIVNIGTAAAGGTSIAFTISYKVL